MLDLHETRIGQFQYIANFESDTPALVSDSYNFLYENCPPASDQRNDYERWRRNRNFNEVLTTTKPVVISHNLAWLYLEKTASFESTSRCIQAILDMQLAMTSNLITMLKYLENEINFSLKAIINGSSFHNFQFFARSLTDREFSILFKMLPDEVKAAFQNSVTALQNDDNISSYNCTASSLSLDSTPLLKVFMQISNIFSLIKDSFEILKTKLISSIKFMWQLKPPMKTGPRLGPKYQKSNIENSIEKRPAHKSNIECRRKN